MAWLRGALPAIVKIPGSSPHAEGLRATLTLLREKMANDALGQSAVLNRLAAILLVQAVRAYIADGGARSSNWLAGFADKRIGRALRAFHADVAADWTVERLARVAGMSRSSFAARFHDRVGTTPLGYVSRWRLHQVPSALVTTSRPFAAIAADSGYRSRAYCAQAFRQLYGHPPGVGMALCLAERAVQPYSGLLLAAGFVGALGLPDHDTINATFFAAPVDWTSINRNKGDVCRCWAGDDDPCLSLERTRAVAEQLAAPLEIIPNGGHLNAASGFDRFPAMLDAILALR